MALLCASLATSLALLAACSALAPSKLELPHRYALDRTPLIAASAITARGLVLMVRPPRAAAGFDTVHMIYSRNRHELEYFAHSEWVESPARMLAPLLVAALTDGGAFRAVLASGSAARGDLWLETEILHLQQEFDKSPSTARFALRAELIDAHTRGLLAWREFDISVPAASDSPQGGVMAANQAVQTALTELTAFCAESAGDAQAQP